MQSTKACEYVATSLKGYPGGSTLVVVVSFRQLASALLVLSDQSVTESLIGTQLHGIEELPFTHNVLPYLLPSLVVFW